MKKAMALAVVSFLFFLSSCNKAAADKADKLGRSIAEAERASIVASVTADYGDKVYIFGLKLLTEGEDWSVEVLEPENIAGITAHCRSGECKMEYDGLILDTGEFRSTDITPVNALPLIVSAWGSAHISEVLPDGDDRIWVTYTASDIAAVRTLYDTASSLPVLAYIEADGLTVITAQFQNIVTNEHVLL